MDSNLKNLILPSGWNEVPVGMFQELSTLDKSEDGMTKIVDLISILADKDPEDVKNINASDLDSILAAIQWTSKTPSNEHKMDFVIDEVPYYLMKLSDLSIGERIDLDAYSKDIMQLHKFFALLYRPPSESLGVKEYSVESMLTRAELFEKKLMIEDVYGTIVFFFSIASRYEMTIQAYTKN